jgi:RNA polymerase sigma-70 factor (ECF subfamily)
VATRETDAFGRFYKDNVRGLCGYVARLIPGSPDADDIASEAFSRVFAASTTDRPVPPKSYLFVTAHNLAMNHLRGRKVRGPANGLDELVDYLADATPTAERQLIARQRLALLWEAVDHLPPRTRQVFIMRKVELLSNPEIAERLGISVSLVEKLIRSGLRTCRAYLDEREGNPTCAQPLPVEQDLKHG